MNTTTRLRVYMQFSKYTWQLVTLNETSLFRVRSYDEPFTEWAAAPAALIELLDTRALEDTFDGEVEATEDEAVLIWSGLLVPESLMERLEAYPGAIWADDHDYS